METPPGHNLLAAPVAETVFEPRVGGHIVDRATDSGARRDGSAGHAGVFQLRVQPSDQPETYYDHRMGIPVGQLMNIVVDCPDASISARFWAAVLGWERVQETPGSVDIADPSDGRRRLVFQQIADYRPPGWPDQGPPQQLHLDVGVDDLQIADQRVRALGAVPLGERVVLEDETYRVYADPAGHPFCLVQPETS